MRQAVIAVIDALAPIELGNYEACAKGHSKPSRSAGSAYWAYEGECPAASLQAVGIVKQTISN